MDEKIILIMKKIDKNKYTLLFAPNFLYIIAAFLAVIIIPRLNGSDSYFWMALVCFIPLILPSIILHFEYYYNDRYKRVVFGEEQIIIFDGDEKTTINISEITKVEFHIRNMEYDAGFKWFPWFNYGFFRIIVNKQQYIITKYIAEVSDFSSIVSIVNRPIPYIFRLKDINDNSSQEYGFIRDFFRFCKKTVKWVINKI